MNECLEVKHDCYRILTYNLFMFWKGKEKRGFKVMEEKGISDSQVVDQEEKKNGLNSLYFGVSCAFFALGFLSRPEKEEKKLSQLCDKMLQGSTHLLGLLVWRFQRGASNVGHDEDLLRKLEAAEKEIRLLKQMRHEDAKANEKVVGIFASQEQGWLMERKKLRQHIGALLHELRIVQRNKEEAISEMDDKLKEMEDLIQSKHKVLEEEGNMRKELEEKLKKAEQTAEELRESAKREAQEHSTDLWKHKTAFLELVSNQRQLEAEMSRAFRQLEAKREELDSVLEQKEESVLLAQKLSMEVVKIRKDMEQKDKILSAMLRKSKLDTAEKQILLKEVKLSKAKRKQAELETDKWKVASEPGHDRHSLRSMFSHQLNSRSDGVSFERGSSQIGNGKSKPADYMLEYENPEFQKDWEFCSPFSDRYSVAGNEELADIKRLERWIRSEAEKYAAVIEKRHHADLEAFVEQMRLKDEKLQAFSWRLMSMEIESKRLQSHVEGLNQDLLETRHENMKLEALLLEKQEEIKALKEQITAQIRPRTCPTADLNSSHEHVPALAHDCMMSEFRTDNQESAEKEQEKKADLTETPQGNDAEKEVEDGPPNPSKIAVQSPEKEFEEEKDVSDQCSSNCESASHVEINNDEKLASSSQQLTKANNQPWRIDLHALGVSYKIKRLKQQLLVLERLIGKQENGEDYEQNDSAEAEMKGSKLFMSLLDKQVSRYQSLQAKTDELCNRMHDNYADKSLRDASTSRMKVETKTLEHFLEETFQLQRYVVSTGQKLMEVQSKIASGFVQVSEKLDKSANGDMKRFADNVRTLFQEVQRGLEIRIARIIGDLEGTLACEGIIRIGR